MSVFSDTLFPNMQVYYGDLHNHCGLSYGTGPLEDALRNARMQLDFASVTIHAAWPDLPTDDPSLDYLVAYHREGFRKAQTNWPDYLSTIAAYNQDGTFVTFPSFEWHSLAYGDYCIYYQDERDSRIIDAPDLSAMRQALRDCASPTMLIPHHIGYKRGQRGINWQAFNNELSPVAEVFSFHGLSLSSEGPYPYLHSMGPRHVNSTAQYGWALGKVFGIIGSTDHHNAMPGGYGSGRLGVWAESLTRAGIWKAIHQRRTFALTGDRIALAFALNGVPMGGIAPPADTREIAVQVIGGGALDAIDVLHNNRLIHRETIFPQVDTNSDSVKVYKLYIEVGWGEQDQPYLWDVGVQVVGGALRGLEPRLRGYQPTENPAADANYSANSVTQTAPDTVRFQAQTRRNPSLHTPATEGFAITVEGDAHTRLIVTTGTAQNQLTLAELMTGAHSFYEGGFVSPALYVHRAVPEGEYTHQFRFTHQHRSQSRDWYTIRVRQHNGQWAWSSPIWVDGDSTP